MVGDMPFFNSVDGCTIASHMYAIEGGAFVLLASHTQDGAGLRANGLIADDNNAGRAHTAVVGGGFLQIIAPDGRTLIKAPSASYEGMIYAPLDFNEIYMAKNIVDPVGHYSRPDLFTLHVNRNVNQNCVYKDQTFAYALRERYPELPKVLKSTSDDVKSAKSILNGTTNGTADGTKVVS